MSSAASTYYASQRENAAGIASYAGTRCRFALSFSSLFSRMPAFNKHMMRSVFSFMIDVCHAAADSTPDLDWDNPSLVASKGFVPLAPLRCKSGRGQGKSSDKINLADVA